MEQIANSEQQPPTFEQAQQRLNALAKDVSEDYALKARVAVANEARPGKSLENIARDVARVLADFEAGAPAAHEVLKQKIAARQNEAARIMADGVRRVRARERQAAEETPWTFPAIAEALVKAGVLYEVRELDGNSELWLAGPTLPTPLAAQIEVQLENGGGLLDFLKWRKFERQ